MNYFNNLPDDLIMKIHSINEAKDFRNNLITHKQRFNGILNYVNTRCRSVVGYNEDGEPEGDYGLCRNKGCMGGSNFSTTICLDCIEDDDDIMDQLGNELQTMDTPYSYGNKRVYNLRKLEGTFINKYIHSCKINFLLCVLFCLVLHFYSGGLLTTSHACTRIYQQNDSLEPFSIHATHLTTPLHELLPPSLTNSVRGNISISIIPSIVHIVYIHSLFFCSIQWIIAVHIFIFPFHLHQV